MLDLTQSETEDPLATALTAPNNDSAALPTNVANYALHTLARDLPLEQLGLVAFDPDGFAWWSGNEYT